MTPPTLGHELIRRSLRIGLLLDDPFVIALSFGLLVLTRRRPRVDATLDQLVRDLVQDQREALDLRCRPGSLTEGQLAFCKYSD